MASDLTSARSCEKTKGGAKKRRNLAEKQGADSASSCFRVFLPSAVEQHTLSFLSLSDVASLLFTSHALSSQAAALCRAIKVLDLDAHSPWTDAAAGLAARCCRSLTTLVCYFASEHDRTWIAFLIRVNRDTLQDVDIHREWTNPMYQELLSCSLLRNTLDLRSWVSACKITPSILERVTVRNLPHLRTLRLHADIKFSALACILAQGFRLHDLKIGTVNAECARLLMKPHMAQLRTLEVCPESVDLDTMRVLGHALCCLPRLAELRFWPDDAPSDLPDLHTLTWTLPALQKLTILDGDFPLIVAPQLKTLQFEHLAPERIERALTLAVACNELESIHFSSKAPLTSRPSKAPAPVVSAFAAGNWPRLRECCLLFGNAVAPGLFPVITKHKRDLSKVEIFVQRIDYLELRAGFRGLDAASVSIWLDQPARRPEIIPAPVPASLPNLVSLLLSDADDSFFCNLSMPNLQSLELSTHVHLSSLDVVLACCPALVSLVLEGCVCVDSWIPARTWPALRYLRLTNCDLPEDVTLQSIRAAFPSVSAEDDVDDS